MAITGEKQERHMQHLARRSVSSDQNPQSLTSTPAKGPQPGADFAQATPLRAPGQGFRAGLFLAGLLASAWIFSMPTLAAASAHGANADTRAKRVDALSDVVAQVKALLDRDPAAAMRLGEPYWQAGPPEGDRIALGLLLLKAAEALNQDQKVVDIGERLDKATLSPLQHMQVVAYLTAHIAVTRDAGKLKALQDELQGLEKQLPDRRETIARLWRQLAAAYYQINDLDEAQRLARIAVSKVPTHPDKVDYDANQIIAIGYIRQGHMPEAIESMLAADRAGKALGLPDDPSLLQNFTGLFVYTKDWPKVIEYGKRALAAKPSVRSRVSILVDIAAAHAEQDDVGEARTTYAQALALARANHLPTAGILNDLGDMLQKHGHPDRALPLFREAVAAFEHAGNKSDAAVAYSNLGATLVDLGQRQAAAKAFERSLALFAVSDDVNTRLELYPRMVDNLEALGRYREALALMREFKKTSDQHVTVESNTRVAKLQSVIELERQKRQLAEAARKQAAQAVRLEQLQAQEQRQRMLDYAMLGALLLLALVTVIKIRESRTRRRLNLELKQKNAEVQAQHRDLAKLNEAILRQSEEDALTGLRNRRFGQAWLEQLTADLREAQRQERSVTPALLMLLDIDHFKRINDTYGHEAGDQALIQFADILRDCSRQSDALIRWGGEEFLWVCPDTPVSEAADLFARLREVSIRQPLMLKGDQVRLTVSMGVCAFPLWLDRTGDWAQCLRVADAALYRAKVLGRDRWVGFASGIPPAGGLQGNIAELIADGALVQLDGDTVLNVPDPGDRA